MLIIYENGWKNYKVQWNWNWKTHKILVSNKVYFGKKGFKCFIGYNDG